MTPEILAKIMGIIAKTKERVIVVETQSNSPFVLMNLDEYEKMAIPALTANPGQGMIDSDSAIKQEAASQASSDWGGDETAEEDKYYMEPAD